MIDREQFRQRIAAAMYAGRRKDHVRGRSWGKWDKKLEQARAALDSDQACSKLEALFR